MSNPAVIVHSRLSFSGRERWRKCPDSVRMSEGMPDSSGPAALEGSAAHVTAEFYVRQEFQLPGGQPGEAPDVALPAGVDTQGADVVQWNDKLRLHGKAYARFIRSLIPVGEESFASVEMRVSAPSIHKDLFGTADCLVWCPRIKLLIVVDYKYGLGAVEIGTAEDTNPQIAAYAVAALDQCTLTAELLRLAVYQPRRPTGTPEQVLDVPGAWIDIERKKLRDETFAVDKTYEAGHVPNPRPGEHCRYCKAASKCPVVHNVAAAAIQPSGAPRDLLSMSDDELVNLWTARAAFKAFWEDVEERIAQLAKAGHARLAISEKQGRQMWANPADAAQTLLALNMPNLLAPVSISEALPHIPAALHAALIKRSAPSRSIVVLDGDKLAPGTAAAIFAKYAKPVDNG